MSNSLCKLYAFRLNIDLATIDELIVWCDEYFEYWVFQGERGDTGYEHYQGEGSLKKRRRKGEFVKMLHQHKALVPNYLEPLPTGEAKNIRKVEHLLDRYAAKADTRICGPFQSTRMKDAFVPKHLRNKEYSPWQQWVMEQHAAEDAEEDTRTVHWIYDPVGHHGKSYLTQLADLRGEGLEAIALNDYKEITQALCNMMMDREIRDPKNIFIDLPRCLDKSKLHGFISAAEAIKNCKLVDVRNHYKEWRYNCPSVWIFSNTRPPKNALSADRWKVWEFDGPGHNAMLRPLQAESIAEDL